MWATYSKSESKAYTGSSSFIVIDIRSSVSSMWALTTIGRQVIGTYSRAEVICSGLDLCSPLVWFFMGWCWFVGGCSAADICNSWPLKIEAEAENET